MCRSQPGSATAAGDDRQEQLQSYLEGEAGLKPYQADRVLRELSKRPDATTEWLRGRVAGLLAAFGPGAEAEVAAAVYNGGLDILDAEAASFPQQLVALREVLAGVNVLDIVSREPRLLYTQNVTATSKKVISKLTALYPYKSPNKKQDVVRLVAEYPELLVRMAHYADDRSIKTVQDLPVDLQNRILKSYC